MKRLGFKRARRLPQPIHLERAYMRELDVVAQWAAQTGNEEMMRRLPSMGAFKIKVADRMGVPDPMIAQFFPDELLRKMARKRADEVNAFQRQAVTRQLTEAVGVGFWVGRRFNEEKTNKVVGDWIEANMDLIKTIKPQYMDGLESMVRKSIGKGLRVEELSEKIQAYAGVAQSTANLIARDQTLKLYGRLNQARQQSVGLNKYRWRGVLDEAEREMHRELEGQVCSWDNPPVTNEDGDTNHPGEDYQCRCDAEPIFD